MAYPEISLNGTTVSALSLSSGGGADVFQVGSSPRAIDGTLIDLGFPNKERFILSLTVGTLRSWLKALKALASFTFIDFDGNSYTVKMTGLSFKWIYGAGEYVQVAQVTMEEV